MLDNKPLQNLVASNNNALLCLWFFVLTRLSWVVLPWDLAYGFSQIEAGASIIKRLN